MVEPFNKMYLQNLRAMQELRSQGTALIVHSAK
jgi:hypothetical protein